MPKGTVLVSYGGPKEHIYYAEKRLRDEDVPKGTGINIKWWLTKGQDYFDKYFEEIEPVEFEETPWARVLAYEITQQLNTLVKHRKQLIDKHEQQIKDITNKINSLEQQYIQYFGTDPNAETIDVSGQNKEPEFEEGEWYGWVPGTGSTSTGF